MRLGSSRPWPQKSASPQTHYVGAFDGSLLGYAGLKVSGPSYSSDVQTIGVEPESQGKSIGRTLMNELLAFAKRQGSEEVFLEVKAGNEAAIGLYLSLGFEQIDVRKRYYQPSGRRRARDAHANNPTCCLGH
jgi:ribosomal protein S18 acetylase RimI-like enzyme